MNIILATLIVTTNAANIVSVATDSPTNAVRRIDSPHECSNVVATTFPVGKDTASNWVECPLGEPTEPTDGQKYYATDIIAAMGTVLGADRYDAVKSALQQTRIDGTPVWDMFVSGMYIPVDDPRLDQIKSALVESGLMTADDFDRILELAGPSEVS